MATRVFLAIALAAAACVSSAPSFDFPDADLGSPDGSPAEAGPTNDGGPGDAGADVDAGPPCNVQAPFQLKATRAFDNINDGRNQVGASLSPNELTLYVEIDRRIYIARRTSVSLPFDPPTALNIDEGNVFPRHASPTVTRDQRRLYFECGERESAHVCTVGLDPGEPDFHKPSTVEALPGLVQLDPRVYEGQGRLEVWFAASNAPATRSGDEIHSAVVDDGGMTFSEVRLRADLNSDEADGIVVLDPTGRQAIIASGRRDKSAADLFVAMRDASNGTFEVSNTRLAIDSPADEGADWMSPDGCRLYFYSSRRPDGGVGGDYNLYLAERPKK